MNLQRAWTEPKAAKLTVADFMLLDREGALDAYGRTELVDGTIYVVSPQHARHVRMKVGLLRGLADACDALGARLEAWSEATIDLGPHSAPMPDVFITTAMPEEGFVPGRDVALVVEVATTTRDFDLGEKARVYAEAGIPEYWVVDVQDGCVRRSWSPGPGGYAETDEVPLGRRLEAATIPELGVETNGLA